MNSLHGATGPYVERIFKTELGCSDDCCVKVTTYIKYRAPWGHMFSGYSKLCLAVRNGCVKFLYSIYPLLIYSSRIKRKYLHNVRSSTVPTGTRLSLKSVLRIRDVYPGSRIPDPTFFHPGSRIRTISITDPGSRILIKEFKYFNPQKSTKNGF